MSLSGGAGARARIQLTYLWRHGRRADFDRPQRFTEFVQWRKLFDRRPDQPVLMDKVAAKARVEQALGPEWVIPFAWHGPSLPNVASFDGRIIVKARHGCNQNVVLRHRPNQADWNALCKQANGWLAKPYGAWLDEWAYRDTQRGIVAEPLIGEGVRLPIDYKIYVFGGRATHVQVHLGRGRSHRWFLHDRQFRPLVRKDEAPDRPHSLPAMLKAAETLSQGRDFLRVDFYEQDRKPLFGEFCLYPGSGLDPFAADWIDHALGDLWREALPIRQCTSGANRGVPQEDGSIAMANA